METINILILSKDKEYAGALAWAIVRNTKGMEVWVSSDPYEAAQHAAVQNSPKPDVILTDLISLDDRNGKDPDEPNKDHKKALDIYLKDSRAVLICLSERVGDEDVKRRTLFKYKNVREMVSDIYCIYGEEREISEISDTEHRKDIYCFISERGGSGCSTVCSSFAAELTRARGSSVLSLTLEQFPEHSDKGAGNIKKYLYHILKGNGESPDNAGGVPIRAFVIREENGVDRFRQSAGQNPLLELDEDGFTVFVKRLAKDSEHDVIVIDCGSQITMQMVKAMQLSKRVFFVKDDRPERTSWRNCMGMITDEKVIERIVPVVTGNGRTANYAAELVEQFA